MSVLIQQATLRQVKALSKRLQTVIPEVLATGPLSLSQAQAIAAKGLGHADFHAAQRFHRDNEDAHLHKTTTASKPDNVLTGPPDVMIETLLQHLGRYHEPTWQHWLQCRRMIALIVHSAWDVTWGASLTPEQLLAGIPEDASRLKDLVRQVDEARLYLKSLREPLTHDRLGKTLARHAKDARMYLNSLPGPLTRDHFNDEALAHHRLNIADWTRVLTDLSHGSSRTPSSWDEAHAAFQRLIHRPYSHSLPLKGSVSAIMQELGVELDKLMRVHGVDPIWTRRGFDLVQTVIQAMLKMDLPDGQLTRGQVLDALALPHLAMMAHEKGPLMEQPRETVRLYLKSLPGYEPEFSRTDKPVPLVSSLTAEQHERQFRTWSKLLRRT